MLAEMKHRKSQIGTSMADPNLRKLLRSSQLIARRWHYAFLPKERLPTKQQMMFYTLFDSDLLKLGVRVIRFPKRDNTTDPYSHLSELIDLLIKASVDQDFVWDR
jgi:hypothetical protein